MMHIKSRTKIVLVVAMTLTASALSAHAAGQGLGHAPGMALASVAQKSLAPVASHSASLGTSPTLEATTTTMAPGTNPVRYGLGITVTATVTSPPSAYGTPRGVVHLMDGSSAIVSKWLDVHGAVTFTGVNLSSGDHGLSVAYAGAWHFAPSSSPQWVEQVAPSTYVGALPFAFNPGPITDRTNVVRVAQALAATPAAGISWRFRWSDIEPSPGVFDWTPIDNSISAAQSVHLPVILHVIAGLYSPSWVLAQARTVSVPNVYFPNTGPYPTVATLPVPWDPTYLSDWESFSRAFAARYDGNSAIYLVDLSGGGDIGDMYLPADMTVWRAAGYSDASLESAWQQIITTYAQAFTKTPIGLSIAESFSCNSVSAGFTNPTCAAGWKSDVLQPLAAWVAATYPGRIWMQNNGLKPKYSSGIFLTRQILRADCQLTTVGYQMNGTMNSPTALYDSFVVAREDQVGYVEVYPNDLSNSADAAALHFLQYG
jgi:hypothetical protein